MERIGTSAFRGCTGLRSITIGPGVFVGSYILAYNDYFRDAYEAGGAGTYTADSYDGVWTKVVIPITAIGAIAGTPGVGAELTAGTLTPAEATAVYQWSICDTIDGTYVNIPGAVSSTYTPVAGDAGKYIKVTVTGTGDYSGSVTSPAAGPVESPVQVTVTGASITGTARVEETLTAVVTPGDATNVTYQWQANTGAEGAYADIAGATDQTFIISEELAGKTIRVIVNGDNGSSATSEATDIVEAADP
jgi:hypothetical protein